MKLKNGYFSSYCPLQVRVLKHNLMMAMREICCTDEGDQSLKKACSQEILKTIQTGQLIEDNG